jgi:hypothetical protein
MPKTMTARKATSPRAMSVSRVAVGGSMPGSIEDQLAVRT